MAGKLGVVGSDSEVWNQASVTDLELIIINLGFADIMALEVTISLPEHRRILLSVYWTNDMVNQEHTVPPLLWS